MKNHPERILLFVLIGLGVLLLRAAPSAALAGIPAQAVPVDVSACHNLDLVVLIDQSASMKNNDVNRQRIEVAKLIIEQLGNHAILLCPDQNIIHRLAVFGFGDRSSYLGAENDYTMDTVEYLSPQSIPTTYNYENWITTRDALQAQINTFRNDNLGYTDHKSALLRARDVLQMWKQQPIGSAENRRQAILLITDGEACTGSGGCSINASQYQFDQAGYMSDLIETASPSSVDFPHFANDPDNSVFISMVAMADSSQTFNYRTSPTFRNGWMNIIGERGQIYDTQESNLDLSAGMFEILRPLIGSNLTEWDCQQPIYVVPYLDSSLVININRQPADSRVDPGSIAVFLDVGTAGQTITLESGEEVWADGTRHPLPAAIKYTADGGDGGVVINENYAFTRPWPGVYNIRTQGGNVCRDVSVNYGKGSVTAVIRHPAADTTLVQTPQEPYYNELSPDRFSLTILDKGLPLREIESFPLQIRADIKSMDGTQDMGTLSPGSEGVYDSADPIHLRASGDYTWTATGCVESPTELVLLLAQGYAGDVIACPWASAGDNMLQVFQSVGGFSVFPVSFFSWQIANPADGAMIAMNNVSGGKQVSSPIPISVEIVGEDGKGLPANDVFLDPDNAFRADLFRIDSDTLVESVSLSPASRDASLFTGQFTNSNPAGSGEYRVVVSPNWTPSTINRVKFAPATGFGATTATHTQYEIFPLDVRIIPPTDITLHRTTILQCFLKIGDCFGNAVLPFDFNVELVNMKTGQVVALADALANANGSHKLKLAAPSGQEEEVTLVPLEAVNLQMLQALKVGTELDESGVYTIDVPLGSIALREGYKWTDARRTVTFERKDTLMTNPLLAKGLVILVGLILLALLAWFIYGHVGGPTGQLTYVAVNSLGQIAVEGGSPWRLTQWRRVNKIRNGRLKEKSVASIRVTRTSALMDSSKRAIYVEAEDTQGMPLFSGPMEEGDIQPFNDGQLRYGEQRIY